MKVKYAFLVGLLACVSGCVAGGGAETGASGDAPETGASAGEPPASSAAVAVAPLLATTEADVEAMALSNEANGVTALIVSPGTELLATLELQDGSQITWLRDSEGLVVGNQILDARTPAAFTREDLTLGPAETFRRMAPGQAVPASLLEAQRDQELRVARAPNTERIARGDRLLEPSSVAADASRDDVFRAGSQEGLIQQALIDDSKCPAENMNDYCDFSEVCHLWKTGDAKVARSDKRHVITYACTYRGNITHRLDVRHWDDWKIVKSVTLKPGQAIKSIIYADGWPTDFDFEAIIQNASGDGWHQAVAW